MNKKKILICAIFTIVICACITFLILTKVNYNNKNNNSIIDNNTEIIDTNNSKEENIEQEQLEQTENKDNILQDEQVSVPNEEQTPSVPQVPTEGQQQNQPAIPNEEIKPSVPSTPEVTIVYYADATEDGKIDIADVSMIKSHIEGTKVLTGQALKNADINNDGKVNKVDEVLLQGALANIYSHEITKPLTNYILYADATEDGKIDIADVSMIKSHVEGTKVLTGQALKNADVNNDGVIDKKDSRLVQEFLAGMHKSTLPYKPII